MAWRRTMLGILLIGPLGTNFSEILIGIQAFSFKKLHLKTSSAKWRLFCLGLNELMLMWYQHVMPISASVKVCNWHFVLPYIYSLIWALSRMSHVSPINKLAALLCIGKPNCWAQLLLKNVSYWYLELGRWSYSEFISASSICNLDFSMSFKHYIPHQNHSCIFSFFSVLLFCVWWVPHTTM